MTTKTEAEIRVALMREVLIGRALEVLQARTTSELIAAGLHKEAVPSVGVEHANGNLEWAAVSFATALSDPALMEDE